MESAIELRGICKSFGTVKANDDIDLSVRRGEILALLGENGSGKTTLMNILSGIYSPDSGSIEIMGKEVSILSPKDAIGLGIGMIHQHFKLVDVLTATENIVVGTKTDKRLSKKALSDKIRQISTRFGLELQPDKRVNAMSVSEKQTVEILKVLYRGADILILDEPTAVLTPQETRKLFDILRKMKSENCAVIIITHKLNEVMEISDRVAILRKGRSVKTVTTAKTNERELTELMVGRPVELAIKRPETDMSRTLLEIYHLSAVDEENVRVLEDVNFDLRCGEILGVAGVAGSGQRELCEIMAGLYKITEGAILYNKGNIVGKTPDEIIHMGISMSFIPEDRLGMGLVASMDMVDNLMLKSYRDNNGAFIDRKPARSLAARLIDQLGIVTPDMNTPVSRLSGGNVQKVLLGREIESEPNVIITAYPVRGLDINSSYTIYDLLNRQKEKGVGILFIGEDLDVLMELCDRIMVLCGGKVTGIVNPDEVTKDELGLLMAGRSLTKEAS